MVRPDTALADCVRRGFLRQDYAQFLRECRPLVSGATKSMAASIREQIEGQHVAYCKGLTDFTESRP